jgi:SAM-dependent methyltransferase
VAEPNWEKSFFRNVAVDFWSRVVPPELTASEVDFLEEYLELGAGDHVLDVPCGNGRHAIELARRGYRATGVDQSEDFLEIARAASDGLPVEWRRSDMRDLPWEEAFDGAFCWGNSFGYLDREGVRLLLGSLNRALRPGSRFVADIPTVAESLLSGLKERQWHKAGDIYVLSDARYDASAARLDIDYTFLREGATETRRATSYIFTAGELRHLFASEGWEVEAMLGSLDGAGYTLGAPSLTLVAGKP